MNLKKYLSFTVEDFIVDEGFIRWIKFSNTADNQFWESFLKEHPEMTPVINDAKTTLAVMMETPSRPALSDAEKGKILGQIKRQIKPSPRVSIRYMRAIAAAAAILLVSMSTWYFVDQASNGQELISTVSGQQQLIQLPDGSEVKLNANSSLRFDKNWDDYENRKVWLTGEAFFEVAKNLQTGQKFQVITNDLVVEVLGTIFNVNSHQEATKVFLEEGKVKLTLKGLEQSMIMEPGELVAYSESVKEQPKKIQVVAEVHTSWKDGFLLFDDTPLRDVLEKIEEIYGVTIQLKDSIQFTRGITTGVPVGNLEEALSILEMTMGLQIRKGNIDFIIE